MPNKMLENLAEKTGKTVREAEECWSKAKEQAKKKFPKDQWESDEFYRYTTITTQICMGYRSPKKAKK